MDDEIRIVLAEDHPFLRDGVRRVLAESPSLRVVAEAADGATALERIRAERPELAVLDIGLPKLDGIAVVRAVRRERIAVEVVFLTICEDDEVFEEAIELGVKGYLLKDCTSEELLRCVTAVMSGQHYVSPKMATYLVSKVRRVERFAVRTAGIDRLTGQEREILRRIADGLSSKEIADQLAISRKTVDAHRANICNKLEIHGQYGLTRFAVRHRADL